MHTFPIDVDEIPQDLAIYGQLIKLTSICIEKKQNNDKWHPFEKGGERGNIQWLAVDSIAHSVGER